MMGEKARGGVVTGLTLAMAGASMAMTVADRLTGEAKSAAELDGRVKALERVQGEHAALHRVRGTFVREAREQINFLCQTQPECRRLYVRIDSPE